MTIETTVTESKKVVKEITLPYYSKGLLGRYYMIREDETVVQVIADKYDGGILVVQKPPYGTAYLIEDAAKCKPISKEEFEEATERAVEFMDNVIKQLQPA